MRLGVELEDMLRDSDDEFHRGEGDYFTEGSWWSFFNIERRISGWFYHLTRLKLGIASGGVWIWDDRSTQWYEAPYFALRHLQRVSPSDSMRDMKWADGSKLRSIEPFKRYAISYDDGERLALDLQYDAVTTPFVSADGDPLAVKRVDQLARATGTIMLDGEAINIDCLAMFDHSWGPRPEHHPRQHGTAARTFAEHTPPYLWGAASGEEAFFVMAGSGIRQSAGARANIPHVTQQIERDPATGHIISAHITGVDTLGRPLNAVGRPINLLIRPSAGAAVGFIYTMDWDINGHRGNGDIQDVLPVETWAACRKAQ